MGTVKQQSGSPGEGAPQQLFVRQATGLVRGVKVGRERLWESTPCASSGLGLPRFHCRAGTATMSLSQAGSWP